MKTLIAFSRRTGRRIKSIVNALVDKLADGQLKIGISVSIPFFVRISLSYTVKMKKVDKTA